MFSVSIVVCEARCNLTPCPKVIGTILHPEWFLIRPTEAKSVENKRLLKFSRLKNILLGNWRNILNQRYWMKPRQHQLRPILAGKQDWSEKLIFKRKVFDRQNILKHKSSRIISKNFRSNLDQRKNIRPAVSFDLAFSNTLITLMTTL